MISQYPRNANSFDNSGFATENSQLSSALSSQPDELLPSVAGALRACSFIVGRDDGQLYAKIMAGDRTFVYPVASRSFKRWLCRRLAESSGRLPTAGQTTSMVEYLCSIAADRAPVEPVARRLIRQGDRIFLDLCDGLDQTVAVDANGWRIVARPPVNFIRSAGMLGLPAPQKGGCLQELRPFVNVKTDEDFSLYLAWLVAALNPDGPFPVLFLSGEAGSSKSTLTRVAKSLLDPNDTPTRGMARGTRDLLISARHTWILAMDNLSSLSHAQSDDLCRLATGAGFSTRQLYTDAEETRLQAMRPIIINGIDPIITRGDLLDRSIMLELPSLAGKYKTESDLWADFEKARPRILGALLDAVSCALRNQPCMNPGPALPRMADFARWVSAAEPSFQLNQVKLSDTLTANQKERDALAIHTSPIGPSIVSLAARHSSWAGTASDLLGALESHIPGGWRRRPAGWPRSPDSLGKLLQRLKPICLRLGITVTNLRSSTCRRIQIASKATPALPELLRE